MEDESTERKPAFRTKGQKKVFLKARNIQKQRDESNEIEELEERISKEAPPRGSNPLAYKVDEKREAAKKEKDSEDKVVIVDNKEVEKKEKEYEVYYPAAKNFADLPISSRTKKGLKNSNFVTMTDIQRAALAHALCGRDVLGAAKTGSGKTLAFLIPMIEKMYRMSWSKLDGVGAIVITPTRELAVQIFEVLRNIGSAHDFSAGLIIGGKDVKHEQDRINGMNIIICTPGRLLQHMDQTRGFDCSNLQTLVLDEADRILDMGFQRDLTAILDNLPKERQTLLFSATQTKSVKDLARLSLKDPEFISVHEKSEFATPSKLQQYFIMTDLDKKLDTLYNFIKTHLKNKILVFFSSCKQVRFVFESFRKLRPGIPLMNLHGKMDQTKRMAIFFDFLKKGSAVLFATDIAARGLDFPTVDWVVQVDCPEDPQSYIHRVGRTARYESGGNSVLFIIPSEKAVIPLLEKNRIPLKKSK